MADGVSTTDADAILAAMLTGVSYVRTNVYAQLHVGAPGASGTANVAVNNTRVNATGAFPAPAAGSSTSTVALQWANVPAAEQYTHLSLWTASAGGTFIASGALSGPAVNVGDSYSIPAGQCTVSMPVAA